jgi:hypothetical protein
VICAWTLAVPIQGQTLREYQVKGAFLVNFAKFIEWPDDAFDGPSAPLDVCFVGARWIYDDLATTIADKLVGKRPIRLRAPGDTTGCHLLFVGGNQAPGRIFAPLADFTVRVGEEQPFLAAGGHISFHLHGARVHFEIAPNAAQHKTFKISSRLIVLADKDKD